LKLAYQLPYQWQALLDFMRPRAIPGVEEIGQDRYRRTLRVDGIAGHLEVQPLPGENQLWLTVSPNLAGQLPQITARVRRVFGLDVDPGVVAGHLSQDPLLSPILQAYPGLRLPGTWDGFEIAVRAILGQQISVQAASTLAGRLVAAYGEPFNETGQGGLRSLFPRPEQLAGASLLEVGMPAKRRETIRSLAAAVAAGQVDFSMPAGLDNFVASLISLPGIGPWTAHYIALRLGAPDAFPSGDLGLRRAVSLPGTTLISEKDLLRMAERWRPWRAYAAIYLWMMHSTSLNTHLTGLGDL
jgi:AraC family transcriptional regulator of adaptative response / DNA-3-methyladenine glycosylase II